MDNENTQSPVSSPAEPGNSQQPGAQSAGQSPIAPAGYVEKARLDGALQKIQELTLTNRVLTQEVEQLRQAAGTAAANLAEKEATMQASVGEKSASLAAANAKVAELEAKLRSFTALQMKIKAINDAGSPELFRILDTIPDETDETALKGKITSLAAFAKTVVQQRETQLLAGVVPQTADPSVTKPNLPASGDDWLKRIEALPLGSMERDKAWQEYYAATFLKK